MSYFLSYPPASLCVHEPWTRRINPSQYRDDYHYLGVAEQGIESLDLKFLKRARVVFVQDRFEEPSYVLQQSMDRHPQKIITTAGMVKCPAVALKIWDFCLPGIPLPEDWWEECKHKRIELQEKEDYSSDYTEHLKRTVRSLIR